MALGVHWPFFSAHFSTQSTVTVDLWTSKVRKVDSVENAAVLKAMEQPIASCGRVPHFACCTSGRFSV
jgi:hypothetical protein